MIAFRERNKGFVVVAQAGPMHLSHKHEKALSEVLGCHVAHFFAG